MKIELKRHLPFWKMFMLMFALSAFIAVAQEADDEEEDEEAGEQAAGGAEDPNAILGKVEVWKEWIKKIEKDVAKEVDQKARQEVTKAKVLENIQNGYVEKNRRFKGLIDMEAEIIESQRKERRIYAERQSRRWKEKGEESLTYPDMSQYYELSNEVENWSIPTKIEFDLRTVEDQLKKELQAKFDEVCKQKTEEALQKEYDEDPQHSKYRVVEGEPKPYVEIKLRDGRGTNSIVSGRLDNVTQQRLRVGNRWLNRMDLSPEDEARFYDDAYEKMRGNYVAQKQRVFNAQREIFVAEWVSLLLPDYYMKAGYFPGGVSKDKKDAAKVKWPYPKRRRSADLLFWMPKDAYLDFMYRTKLEAKKKELYPVIEEDYFTHAKEKYSEGDDPILVNFVKVEGEGGKKEWQPEGYAEYVKAQAANAQAGPGGPGGPDGPPPM